MDFRSDLFRRFARVFIYGFLLCLSFHLAGCKRKGKTSKTSPRLAKPTYTPEQRKVIERVKLAKTSHGGTVDSFVKRWIVRTNKALEKGKLKQRAGIKQWTADCNAGYCQVAAHFSIGSSKMKAEWLVQRNEIKPTDRNARMFMAMERKKPKKVVTKVVKKVKVRRRYRRRRRRRYRRRRRRYRRRRRRYRRRRRRRRKRRRRK